MKPTKNVKMTHTKALRLITEIKELIHNEIQLLDDPLLSTKGISDKRRKRSGMIYSTSEEVNTFGEMIFDKEHLLWVGNDEDGKLFDQSGRHTLPLIRSLNKGSSIQATAKGMTYDPVNNIWKGNEDVLDEFDFQEQISVEPAVEEVEFKVGNEFSLSDDMLKSFTLCEQEFRKQLGGWTASFKETQDEKSYLYIIREMSINKIVSQAKGTRHDDTQRKPKTTQQPPADETTTTTPTATKPSVLTRFKETQEDDFNGVDLTPAAKNAQHKKMTVKEEDWDDISLPVNTQQLTAKLKQFTPNPSATENIVQAQQGDSNKTLLLHKANFKGVTTDEIPDDL